MKKNSQRNNDKQFIPLSSNNFNLEAFISELKNSTSPHFFLENEKVRLFEEQLKLVLKTKKEVVCVSSGTAAIHLALLLAGVCKGDYVICQSFTYIATVNPVLYLGAIPIFIDSNQKTWNMDTNVLEEALNNLKKKNIYPKAIIAVNIYGMPTNIESLLKISKKYQIKLIEDAAESLGSAYNNKSTGTQGDFGVVSFNTNKIITTGGGGAVICKSKKEKEKVLFYANQAREMSAGYVHHKVGFNYRFSNIQAILGEVQLNCLEQNINKRRKNHQFYKELFHEIKGIKILKEPNDNYFSNHWLSCVLIDEKVTGFTKEDLRLQLEKNNIETRLLWKPMHLQPLFNNALFYGENVAESLFKNGLCLPSGSNLTDEDRNRIQKSILELIKIN